MTFMQTHAGELSRGQDAAAYEPGARIGPWEVEREIGSGGMGRVYRARRADGLYDQTVAIKSVRLADEASVARFERERKLLAAMEHPGIARIVDGGTDETGAPYMATEFVDGLPIAEHAQRSGSDARAIAAMMIELARATSHAHSRLVLHRDIKSDNVLVDADGRVRLIDFGISGALAAQARPDGALTAAIAAPEVLAGQPASVRSDVFSLGVLLATLLGKERPRRGEEGGMVVAERLAGDADLAAIAAKATHADPEARYASADAFASDLDAWRSHRPVTARKQSRGYLASRFIRRYRVQTALGALALVALVAGLGVSLWQRSVALDARDMALAEEARSDAVRESLYTLLAESSAETGADDPRGVLSAATARLYDQYAANPAANADTLQALGELQFHLGDYQAALTTFDNLLAHGGEIDPAVRAEGQFNAARASWRSGGMERARTLLAAAQDYWESEPEVWALRLQDSRLVESQIMRETDPEGALALLRTTLERVKTETGAVSARAATFHSGIANALFAAGSIEEAETEFERTLEVYRELGDAQSVDALNVVNNLAAIKVMRGDLEGAGAQFAQAVEIRDALFGPSAATAALHSNYGKVLLQTGREEEALRELELAARMSETYAGAESILHIAALAGLAEAELATGGRDAMASAREAVALADRLDHPQAIASANLALARVAAAEGNAALARPALTRARAQAQQMGPAGARLIQQADMIAQQLD